MRRNRICLICWRFSWALDSLQSVFSGPVILNDQIIFQVQSDAAYAGDSAGEHRTRHTPVLRWQNTLHDPHPTVSREHRGTRTP